MVAKKRSLRKRWHDPDEAPELTGRELSNPKGVWRINDREVSPPRGKAAFAAALIKKTRINMHLDNDVIAYYRHIAAGRGYQTLINMTLRRDMESSSASPSDSMFELIMGELRALRQELVALKAQQATHLRADNMVFSVSTFEIIPAEIHSSDSSDAQVVLTQAPGAQPLFGDFTRPVGNA